LFAVLWASLRNYDFFRTMQMPADPLAIRASFLPFVRPDYVEGMLIGDDLDSLLSAMLLQERYGWPIAGVYCKYTRLWHNGTTVEFLNRLYSGRIVAIDLDIHHYSVPSLGHHILSIRPDDDLAGFTHTLNPNLIRGFAIENQFWRKYPLSTIHFLVWLFREKSWLSGAAENLLWLADSSYINAQRYIENVSEWCVDFFAFQKYVDKINYIQSAAFEVDLKENVLDKLAVNKLCRPLKKSDIYSQYLGLNGFQCQYDNPTRWCNEIQHLLHLLAEISQLPLLKFPVTFTGCIHGERKELTVKELKTRKIDFAQWLIENNVFSYAFVYKDLLNYTVIPAPQ
jgi:hypothetical protein